MTVSPISPPPGETRALHAASTAAIDVLREALRIHSLADAPPPPASTRNPQTP